MRNSDIYLERIKELEETLVLYSDYHFVIEGVDLESIENIDIVDIYVEYRINEENIIFAIDSKGNFYIQDTRGECIGLNEVNFWKTLYLIKTE